MTEHCKLNPGARPDLDKSVRNYYSSYITVLDWSALGSAISWGGRVKTRTDLQTLEPKPPKRRPDCITMLGRVVHLYGNAGAFMCKFRTSNAVGWHSEPSVEEYISNYTDLCSYYSHIIYNLGPKAL